MTSRLWSLVVAASVCAAPLAAQRGEPTPTTSPLSAGITYDRSGVGDTSIFAPLELRAPNIYRSASGAPGPKYWQNRADYAIKASLDTTAKTL
ncbi:MAG: hypothetical protein ABI601_21160, partial [bacterium]